MTLELQFLIIFLFTIFAILTALSIMYYLRYRRRRQVIRERDRIIMPSYRVGHELGRGMNAVTFRVQDIKNTDLSLVAKMLLTPEEEPRINRASFSRHIARFRREMDNLEKLKGNKYIVPVHAFHRNALMPFFVMRFCEGSLADELGYSPFPIHRILNVLIDVCRGLMYSHHMGIIHRDLKPSNILKYKGRWVLADFGMSLLDKEGSMVSVPESLPGTIPYTAPEVMYYEPKSIGPPADIFSLGVTIKEMLTGTSSWNSRPSERLEARIDERIRREVTLFDKLVTRMISLRPEDRPQTITLVTKELWNIFGKINERRTKIDKIDFLERVDELKIYDYRDIETYR